MKMRLFFIFAFIFFVQNAYSLPLGDAVREVDGAAFRVIAFCEYSVKVKYPDKISVPKIMWTHEGNGSHFLHGSEKHFGISAKHIIACDAARSEVYPDLTDDDVLSFEKKLSIKVHYGINYFNARVSDHFVNGDQNIDAVIFEIDMPKGFAHAHNPVLTDESEYDIGSEVIVRGFMPCSDQQLCDGDGWVRRLKFANIEGLTRDKIFIQLNTPAYSGMSGSPVLIWKNGKFHIIGIFVISYASQRSGVVDISWATRLKKEYFDLPAKMPEK